MHEFLAGTRAFLLAIAVHVIMAALVVLGTMDWKPFRPPVLTGLTIEAVMVDTGVIKKRREEAKNEAEKAAQQQAKKDDRAKRLEARKKRQEKQRIEEEAAEKERLKKQAENKREEDMRLQRLRQKQEQDRKDLEKKRSDEIKQLREQREVAAREAKLQEERLNQIEARRQAEADTQRQAIAEEDLQRQMAAETRSGELATLDGQYQAAITAQVTNNWLRPPTARSGLKCKLSIIQIPGGEVISASISGACNADEATRRSLVAAVERAGSLPYRGFEDVFQREIDFTFTYDGN